MKNNWFRKGLVVGIIVLFIGMGVVSSTSNLVEKICINIMYSPHDPIYIHGNDNFTSENGVTGGIGTSYDPYVIKDWEINASSQHGITIRNVNMYFTIRGCYVHAGGTNKDGIVFKNVTNGKIEDTIIKDNRYGIIFRQQDYPWENSSYNIIKNNTITDNTKDGIHFEHTLSSYHSDNLIFLNTISGNNQGIFMVMSAYNHIFSNNIISNSEWGVNLTMCMGGGENNKVYHNNFVGNNNENGQGCAWWTLGNDWDDGYPSGGNFWSDYDGIDSDGDGIGDTPYEILVYGEYDNDYDYYPLMNPWGGNLPPFPEFTWMPEHPDPGEPILFNASESIDYDGYITLYEWDWDDDGEYDENHTSPTATHTYEEAGFYPVTLRVHDNSSANNTILKTIRVGNHPPYEPSNPYPPNSSTNVTPSCLEWTGGDPDGDEVYYDVYFGKTTPPPQVVWNISQTGYCPPGTWEFNTTYYWKIVAWDEYGASTEGPIWSFTTRSNQPPDAPTITGPMGGKPNIAYDFTFNAVDPDGDDVRYIIDWGDGDSETTSFATSGTDVTVSHTWTATGTYTLTVKAEDVYGAVGDETTGDIIIEKSKAISTPFLNFLQNHPNLFPILRQLLGLQ